MSLFSGPITSIKTFTANLAQAAGTYDLCTASGGNIIIHKITLFVATAGATFTSVSFQTNQTTALTILNSTDGAVANLTAEKNIEASMGWDQDTPFELNSTKKIQYTITGSTGTGSMRVSIEYSKPNGGDLV